MASTHAGSTLAAPGFGEVSIPALQYLRQPITARRAAYLLLFLFLITPVVMIFVPWQQSLTASGRVVAFDPTLREQVVEAPVDGRIVKIHVMEGQEVKGPKVDSYGNVIPNTGTLLVSIRDPDPMLMTRLLEQKKTVEQRLKAASDRVNSYLNQINALKSSRGKAIQVAERRIEVAKKREEASTRSLENAIATYKLAAYQQDQQEKLLQSKLTSELNFRQAQQKKDAAFANQERARAEKMEAEQSKLASMADLDKVGFDFDAQILSAEASRQSAEAEVATAKASLADIRVRISRQETQDVYAPCDGTIFRVLTRGAGGGTTVKAGTPLMRVVPDVPEKDRVVELIVDGNDAPLINELWHKHLRETGKKPQIPVRLQFEGYPAVQWVGWPSAAVGTFGGVVDFVDAADDGKGNFRILVRRDPEEEKINPWPRGYALRQGLRANGWVLLNRVSLGWEFWRRLNGFPPVVAGEREDVGKDGSGKKPPVLKKLK